MVQLFFIFSSVALFLARVAYGVVFIANGWPKLRHLGKTAKGLDKMGVKPGVLWGTIIALLEFFGGILLVIGFLVQPVALLLAIEMLVVLFWKIKEGEKLVGGYELDLVLVVLGLVLATSGGGSYALDGFFSLWLF